MDERDIHIDLAKITLRYRDDLDDLRRLIDALDVYLSLRTSMDRSLERDKPGI